MLQRAEVGVRIRLCGFAASVSRGCVLIFAGDQHSTERVQVAAEDGQLKVTFATDLRTIATALQCITALQRADGRFDARVILLSGQKLFIGLRLLNDRLLRAGLRQTQRFDLFGKLCLVLR